MLLAAGFAPMYAQSKLDAPELRAVQNALLAILRQQEPFPAVVMNRHWDIVQTNEAARRFFGLLLGERAASEPANVVRLMFDPNGLRPYVSNWEIVAETLVQRVHREAVGGVPDAATESLLAEVLAYPDVPKRLRRMDRTAPSLPVIPICFRKGDHVFNYFSAITTLGTPQDVTLQELRIEAFFPADPQTEERARALREAPSVGVDAVRSKHRLPEALLGRDPSRQRSGRARRRRHAGLRKHGRQLGAGDRIPQLRRGGLDRGCGTGRGKEREPLLDDELGCPSSTKRRDIGQVGAARMRRTWRARARGRLHGAAAAGLRAARARRSGRPAGRSPQADRPSTRRAAMRRLPCGTASPPAGAARCRCRASRRWRCAGCCAQPGHEVGERRHVVRHCRARPQAPATSRSPATRAAGRAPGRRLASSRDNG